ncbi:hypothetical protein Q7269_07195 [Glaesserella parasuis]|nr:hypothetical protein [Glaesserella parasuis]MDP0281771.1 hypothetical protein [Glaesserella parasuis]MDP0313727.1 hypothetical protein [Glaesserella parasuis]
MKKSLFGLLANPFSVIVYFLSMLIGYWFSDYIEANAIAFILYVLIAVISAMGSFFYISTRRL